MADLSALETWAGALLERLTPQQRAAVARRVGFALRASQSRRIAAQRAPDGSVYAPRSQRSNRLRDLCGSVRRKAMFSKLRTARFLRVAATPHEIGVGFSGRVAEIAHVHQEGQTVSNGRGGTYRMPQRVLLGLSAGDVDFVRDALLDQLLGK